MWHYNANGTANGPVDESVILRLISSGQIIGPIWTLVECGFIEGTFGPNEFGGDPR